MAVYRLHKKSWDQISGVFARPAPDSNSNSSSGSVKAGKRNADELVEGPDEDGDADEEGEGEEGGEAKKKPSKARRGTLPGPEGRKGVSSGLATVVRRGGVTVKTGVSVRGGLGKGGGKSGGGGSKGGGDAEKGQWWAKLPATAGGGGKKGSVSVKVVV